MYLCVGWKNDIKFLIDEQQLMPKAEQKNNLSEKLLYLRMILKSQNQSLLYFYKLHLTDALL